MTEKGRAELFRRASKLLGDDAGIENDPYLLPSNQGKQPSEDKPAYLNWASDVRRWYRFRPHTKDATIWRLHAQGLSVREIGEQVGLDWSWMAKRLQTLTTEIRAAETRRAERPRTLAGLVAEVDPRFLVQILEQLHGL